MALGQNNISIAAVKAAGVGVGSNSLGDLVAKASIGGVAGYAFYIYETRASNGNRYDGYLIPNAKPYWNMWSNKIPARWFCDAGNNFTLNLRLPRNAANPNGGYDFRLHDFRGYEHSDIVHEMPVLMLGDLEVWEGQTIDVTARFDKKQLDLSEANRTGGPITHYLLRFTIGSNDYISTIIPIDNSGVDVPTIQLTPTQNVSITITPFLLPTNVDTGRVMVPSQFFRSDAPGGTNVITVVVNSYPIIGIDSTAIYQLPLSSWPLVDDPGYTEGEILFVDASDDPIQVKMYGGVLPTYRVRVRGDVYPRTFVFKLYRNGVQIGNTLNRAVNASEVFHNLDFGVNVQDLIPSDTFEIIVT